MAVQETSPLGRSPYSVPSALRKASVSVSRKTSADPVVSSESALGQTTSLDRYNSLPIENSLDTTDGLNSRRTSTSFFSRIMTSDTSAAEQAELEIYRTINQIRRDLTEMNQKDQYLSKWIGTLGRKIQDLESVVFTHGPPPPSPMRRTEERRPVPCPSPVDEPYDEVRVPSPARLAHTESIDSVDAPNSDLLDSSGGRELTTITERGSISGDSLDSAHIRYRRSSSQSEALVAFEKKPRPDSNCSGIHAEELFELYRLTEKNMRAEMGLPRTDNSPSKKASEHKEKTTGTETGNGRPDSIVKRELPPFRSYSPNPLVRGEDIAKPVLIYTDVGSDGSESPSYENDLADRFGQRNNALFGSVRLRANSVRVNRDVQA